MACPQIISLAQLYGKEISDRVMYLTRTWAFSIHKHKSILLGRWPEYTHPRKKGDKNTKLHQNTLSQVTNSLNFSGCVLPVSHQHPDPEQQDNLGSGLVPAHHYHTFDQHLVQAQQVPHYDQPPVVPVPEIIQCDYQPMNGVVGWNGGLGGDGRGVVAAACGPDGDTSSGGPVTAIDLFFFAFLQAQQCSRGGRVPGVG